MSDQSLSGYSKIPLTKGKFALVDREDYEALIRHKWFYLNDKYAARTVYIGAKGQKKRVTLKMHQELMKAPKGYEVDHINGEGLHNYRANLRVCTHKQNRWNSKPQRDSSSKYKGVSWQAATQYYKAYIIVDGNYKHLGCYINEDDAARAYNKAALKYHREFANLNPVTGDVGERLKHPYQYKWHLSKAEPHE